jgi:hypothetical protein
MQSPFIKSGGPLRKHLTQPLSYLARDNEILIIRPAEGPAFVFSSITAAPPVDLRLAHYSILATSAEKRMLRCVRCQARL